MGLVALEFCDNLLRLETILQLWDDGLAKIVIYQDFLCIIAFAWLFFVSAQFIFKKCTIDFLQPFTKGAMYITIIPCVLDAAENILMLFTLNGAKNETLLSFTSWLAVFKFALAAIVLFYLLVSLLIIYAKTKKQAIRKEKEFTGRA